MRRRVGIVDMNTHGLDWKKRLRASELYIALVTPNWHREALQQRQYRYARELGKPIVLLVKAGTPLPVEADTHRWYVWNTSEELAQLVLAVVEQRDPRGGD